MAPDELLQQLRRIAVERRISLGALIRESLEDTAQRQQPRFRSLGSGASGYTDTSERASDDRDELFEPPSWR
jgi:hypothetical protein